jgi:hypothetical protein
MDFFDMTILLPKPQNVETMKTESPGCRDAAARVEPARIPRF